MLPLAHTLPALALTIAGVAFLLARLHRPEAARPGAAGEAIYALVILAVLLAWRWPPLISPVEYNPDEGQLAAGALTLLRDPVFFRSVDGTTSGPLNFYVLLPLVAWDAIPVMVATRVTGLLLAGAGLVMSFAALRRLAGYAPALLAFLPLWMFLALTTDHDFVHHSSEHLSFALFAAAGLSLVHAARMGAPVRLRSWIMAGVVIGLLPWAKPQSIVLGMALGLCGLVLAFFSAPARAGGIRVAAVFAFAALAPTIGALLVIAATGQFRHFVESYFINNFAYTVHDRTVSQAARGMFAGTMVTKSFPAWVIATGWLILAGGAAAARARQAPGLAVAGAVLLAVAGVVTVLAPRIETIHYLLYLPPALAWLSLLGAIAAWSAGPRARFGFALAAVALGVLLPIHHRFRHASAYGFVPPGEGQAPRALRIAAVLREFAEPGDELAVWGWTPLLYPAARLPQATRDGNAYRQIQLGAQRDGYYRPRFLGDLQRSRPALFVDSVGTGSFGFNRREHNAHEDYPDLAEYLRRDYVFLVDALGMRLYARRDLLATRTDARHRLEAAVRQLHADGVTDAALPPSPHPRRQAFGLEVLHLQAPAAQEWPLDGQETDFFFAYGLEPAAYERGDTNGAEMLVELVRADGTVEELFRRHLRPLTAPEDRGLHHTGVALPATSARDRLRVRSLPGDHGNNAWDWVFLATPRFARRFGP